MAAYISYIMLYPNVFSWYVSHPIFVSSTPFKKPFHDTLGVLNGWLASNGALESFPIIQSPLVFYDEIVDVYVDTICNVFFYVFFWYCIIMTWSWENFFFDNLLPTFRDLHLYISIDFPGHRWPVGAMTPIFPQEIMDVDRYKRPGVMSPVKLHRSSAKMAVVTSGDQWSDVLWQVW